MLVCVRSYDVTRALKYLRQNFKVFSSLCRIFCYSATIMQNFNFSNRGTYTIIVFI